MVTSLHLSKVRLLAFLFFLMNKLSHMMKTYSYLKNLILAFCSPLEDLQLA
jgi:hypothetical protein